MREGGLSGNLYFSESSCRECYTFFCFFPLRQMIRGWNSPGAVSVGKLSTRPFTSEAFQTPCDVGSFPEQLWLGAHLVCRIENASWLCYIIRKQHARRLLLWTTTQYIHTEDVVKLFPRLFRFQARFCLKVQHSELFLKSSLPGRPPAGFLISEVVSKSTWA